MAKSFTMSDVRGLLERSPAYQTWLRSEAENPTGFASNQVFDLEIPGVGPSSVQLRPGGGAIVVPAAQVDKDGKPLTDGMQRIYSLAPGGGGTEGTSGEFQEVIGNDKFDWASFLRDSARTVAAGLALGYGATALVGAMGGAAGAAGAEGLAGAAGSFPGGLTAAEYAASLAPEIGTTAGWSGMMGGALTPAQIAASAAASGGGGVPAEWTSGFDLAGGGDISGSALTSAPAGNAFNGATAGAGGGTGLPSSVFNPNTARALTGALTGGAGGVTGGSGGGGSGLGDILSLLSTARGTGLIGDGIGTPGGSVAAGNRAAELADPFASQRGQYQTWLSENFPHLASANPVEALNDPAYLAMKEQNLRAAQRVASAGGMLHSGNLQDAQASLGAQLDQQQIQQQFTRNQQALQSAIPLTGATTGSPGAAGQMSLGGFANATNQQTSSLNDLFRGLGAGNAGGSSPITSLLQMFGRGSESGNVDWSSLFGTGASSNLNPDMWNVDNGV